MSCCKCTCKQLHQSRITISEPKVQAKRPKQSNQRACWCQDCSWHCKDMVTRKELLYVSTLVCVQVYPCELTMDSMYTVHASWACWAFPVKWSASRNWSVCWHHTMLNTFLFAVYALFDYVMRCSNHIYEWNEPSILNKVTQLIGTYVNHFTDFCKYICSIKK